MKKIFVVLILSLSAAGCFFTNAQEVNFNDPQTWLLGYFNPDQLLLEPHSSWYNREFDSYKIDSEAFIELSEADFEGIEVLIVLGTWCPDSRRELPRFMKVSQLAGFKQENIKMMGTDSYKEAPIENYDDLNIERVPTFIFYHNKNEIGRIIEYPVASLERDMVNILRDER